MYENICYVCHLKLLFTSTVESYSFFSPPHYCFTPFTLLVLVFQQLALYVLSFLEPKDLLQAAQTCRYWRILAEDNLLWREKCREEGEPNCLQQMQADRHYAVAQREQSEATAVLKIVVIPVWKTALLLKNKDILVQLASFLPSHRYR